jgi:hypothetical protein
MISMKLNLGSGNAIFLEQLFQGKSYAGLLEGKRESIPIQRIIDGYQKYLRGIWGNRTFHICLEHQSAVGPVSVLPPVLCCGDFVCYSPARDPNRAASHLVIMWFQDEFGSHLATDGLSQLRRVPWKEIAEDFDW